VEDFLRHPKAVIELLQQRLAAERSDRNRDKDRLGRLEDELETKGTERDRILGLFRKGLIVESDLERQLGQITREEGNLRANIDDLAGRLQDAEAGATQLQSAQALLERLRASLAAGVSWEVKRQLVEALVGGIRIETIEEDGKRSASVAVTYRFASSIATCTDARAGLTGACGQNARHFGEAESIHQGCCHSWFDAARLSGKRRRSSCVQILHDLGALRAT
jgi:hypothetical protein